MVRLLSFKTFLLFFFINVITHFFVINQPPIGTHVWRQCNTLAMAQNFAQEDMNLFAPKIDRRGHTDGVTGSHFPLFEWLLAWLFKIFGIYDITSRLFSLLIFSLGMLGLFKLFHFWQHSHLESISAGLLLLFVPLNYYDSVNAMPDILALSLGIWSLYYLIKYSQNQNTNLLLIATVLSILTGLIKFQFLIIPGASIVFQKFNKKNMPWLLFSMISTPLCVYLWYQHAIQLTEKSNLREFGLWIKPITLQEKLNTVFNNLIIDLPEMIVGWPLLLAIVFLIISQRKKLKLNSKAYMLIIWAIGFIVFYFIAIERFKHHSYYFQSITPIAVILFLLLVKSHTKSKIILISVLLLQTTWAMSRIIPSRWTEDKYQIPVEFSDKEMRQELSNLVPKGALSIVGPDISGCVYFYFTKTKGYSYEFFDEIVHKTNGSMGFEAMKKHGAKYLIINETLVSKEQIAHLENIQLYRKVGNFSVWLIM